MDAFDISNASTIASGSESESESENMESMLNAPMADAMDYLTAPEIPQSNLCDDSESESESAPEPDAPPVQARPTKAQKAPKRHVAAPRETIVRRGKQMPAPKRAVPGLVHQQLKKRTKAAPPTREELRALGIRKPHRFRPGTVAIREIAKQQRGGVVDRKNLCIPQLPLQRFVREIMHNMTDKVDRWQAEALVALQEAAEAELVEIFQDAQNIAAKEKRVQLKPEDMRAAISFCPDRKKRYCGHDKLYPLVLPFSNDKKDVVFHGIQVVGVKYVPPGKVPN